MTFHLVEGVIRQGHICLEKRLIQSGQKLKEIEIKNYTAMLNEARQIAVKRMVDEAVAKVE